MKTGSRFNQARSFRERLAAVNALRKQAGEMPPGPAKDELLRKVRQADTAFHIDEWANSPGLQPPKS